MGYNGFGLQKWIFTQRARRPFSKDRKAAGEFSDYRHDNDYIDKILSSKEKKRIITEEVRERAAKRLSKRLKEMGQFLIMKRIVVSIFVLLGISFFVLIYINSRRPSDKNKRMKEVLAHSYCVKADSSFIHGKFYKAYDYFMQALSYDSNSFEAYHGLVLVYSNLCGESDSNCVNALKLIERIKHQFPDKDISDLIEIEQLINDKLEINKL